MTYLRRVTRRPLTFLLAVLVVPALTVPLAASAAPTRVEDRQISRTSWTSGVQLRSGAGVGVKVANGSLRLKKPTGRRTYLGTVRDRQLDLGLGRARVRPHRADRVLAGDHARSELGRGQGPGPDLDRHLVVGRAGPVDLR